MLCHWHVIHTQAAVGTPNGVYIFSYDSSTWSWSATLTPVMATRTPQFFGHAVDLHSDTAVVGAYSRKQTGGAVHVYRRAATGVWDLEQTLTHASGISCSIHGDLVSGFSCGWGSFCSISSRINVGLLGLAAAVACAAHTQIVAGAVDESSEPGSTSVAVYRRVEGTWKQAAQLMAPRAAGASGVAAFGASVSVTQNEVVSM